jgi:hypothetical protein
VKILEARLGRLEASALSNSQKRTAAASARKSRKKSVTEVARAGF